MASRHSAVYVFGAEALEANSARIPRLTVTVGGPGLLAECSQAPELSPIMAVRWWIEQGRMRGPADMDGAESIADPREVRYLCINTIIATAVMFAICVLIKLS